ncbi:cytochrome P450 [Datura stramonium]|uniref:Cytochrome P450 n=1 Tax=Datura stramonium TaxID=4076 RepID=A0ABS8SSW2_DATST|nr:cytochrome P450 [Datura stramonium]
MSLYFILPIFFFFFILSRRFRQKKFPPGPRGWPIIGNMMMKDQLLTHRGLSKLAQTYGDILHLQVGYVHITVVSNPAGARQVLQLQDAVFANRPAPIAVRYLSYDCADMAFANYGPFWRQMRKLCVMKLFSRRRAESWNSVRDEVDSMTRVVATSIGLSVNIGELVFGLAKNIIYRAAFGTSSNEGQDELLKIMQEFSKLFTTFNLADFIPWLGWVDPQGLNARIVKARASLDGFIDTIIDDHIHRKKANNYDDEGDNSDMVDELLASYGEKTEGNDSNDLQNALRLTRDNIKSIIMVSSKS